MPEAFLEHYAGLYPAITSAEAMLIIHLLSFKWDEKPPFPGFKMENPIEFGFWHEFDDARSPLSGGQYTLAQKIEVRPPEHLSFDHFEPIDCALHRTLAPG